MKDIKELESILKKIPEDKMNEAELIANELRFIVKQTTQLQKDIEVNGCVENFEQGKQKFLRESPYLSAYNKLMKTYDTFLKQLLNLVPKEVEISDDEIDEKYF